MPRAKRERPPDPTRLVRRAPGDLRSEDGRFEVTAQGGAGRWYVTDTERHDQLGLALVLGPFGTLDDARVAMAAQRAAPAGDDGPLPEPAPDPGPRPDSEPEPEPEPAPEPEPEPARAPVTVTHARWRRRGDERDDVVDAVRSLVDAGLADDPAAMTEPLHPSVVQAGPGLADRVVGREAVVDALRRALSSETLEAYRALDLTVDVVGETAVVTQRRELRRSDDGTHQPTVVRELLVLSREHGRWLVTWLTETPVQDT